MEAIIHVKQSPIVVEIGENLSYKYDDGEKGVIYPLENVKITFSSTSAGQHYVIHGDLVRHKFIFDYPHLCLVEDKNEIEVLRERFEDIKFKSYFLRPFLLKPWEKREFFRIVDGWYREKETSKFCTIINANESPRFILRNYDPQALADLGLGNA